jgi:predicted nucleic-acid-binding protein
MHAVDTDVLVRLIVRDDPRQATAADVFATRGAWVSHVVLVETTWVLDSVFGLGRVQIALAIEMLLDHRDLVVQDADVVAAALATYRKRSRVGFPDCMVLEIARKAGHTPLGTFDRHFSRLEGVELV